MRNVETIFKSLVKHIPMDQFDALVAKHNADYRVRKLKTKSQFLALLYSQFSGASGLREIVDALCCHGPLLYHVGGRPVRRSTLSDANALRPSAVFSELFALMAQRATPGLRRKIAETTYLIDSTSLRLTSFSQWAKFSTGVWGAKVHMIYDPNADRPVYMAVTKATVNDITAAQAMPIQPGATYVFDLGYYDYKWWAKLADQDCRIVTRFKKTTPLTLIESQPVPAGSNILSDRIGYLPQRQKANRLNPVQLPVREVCVKIETGKVLRILSNDLDASAQEIADLYKQRWEIELFFRWVKQVLKIKHFLGASENAIRIQIAVALIAFLVLRLAQAAQKVVHSPLAFAKLVRGALMHRRRIDRLLQPELAPITNPAQLALQWT